MMSLMIGALISIPLSILANILTPRLQTWSAKRSEAASRRQASLDEEFCQLVDRYRADLVAYQAHVHLATMRMTLYFGWALLCTVTGWIAAFSPTIGPQVMGVILALPAGGLLVAATKVASSAIHLARALDFKGDSNSTLAADSSTEA